jgi:hypothetical protein
MEKIITITYILLFDAEAGAAPLKKKRTSFFHLARPTKLWELKEMTFVKLHYLVGRSPASITYLLYEIQKLFLLWVRGASG